jgi:hypothetical protein
MKICKNQHKSPKINENHFYTQQFEILEYFKLDIETRMNAKRYNNIYMLYI